MSYTVYLWLDQQTESWMTVQYTHSFEPFSSRMFDWCVTYINTIYMAFENLHDLQ